MKVLWFTNTPSMAAEFLHVTSNGGGWIESLEKQFSKKNEIQLGIAFPYGTQEAKSFVIGTNSYFSFPVIEDHGKFRKFINRWKHSIEPESVVYQYLDIVKVFQPDLIHIFGTESAYGLMVPYLKIPVIIQIQGNLTVVSKKWFSGVSFIQILRFSYFNNVIRALGIWHYYFKFAKCALREQKIFDNGKYFIGRTDWDRRIAKVLSDDSLYFHCDELLRDIFYETRWTDQANSKLVFYSTLAHHTYKGLEAILETAAILKNKINTEFEWQIAGINGKEEIIRIIEKSYKLRFIDHNINFKGNITAEELASGLLQASIYIHPSHIENSPNSVCEAMLIGMPVIATYAGGIPSMILDKKEGILVQDGDQYAMAGAILELIEDRNYAVELGKNARVRAMNRHNPEKVLNKILEIYSTVVLKDTSSLL